jgi:hypothetical protein
VDRWVDLPAIAWGERRAPGRFVEEHAMGRAGKLTRERDGGRAVRFRGDVLLTRILCTGRRPGALCGTVQTAVRIAASLTAHAEVTPDDPPTAYRAESRILRTLPVSHGKKGWSQCPLIKVTTTLNSPASNASRPRRVWKCKARN